MRIATTIAALLLASNVSANCCASARANTIELMNDLVAAGQVITNLDTSTATESEMKRAAQALFRRVDSARRSLISVRVYCRDNAAAIKWANDIADRLDRLDAVR